MGFKREGVEVEPKGDADFHGSVLLRVRPRCPPRPGGSYVKRGVPEHLLFQKTGRVLLGVDLGLEADPGGELSSCVDRVHDAVLTLG